MAHSCKPGTRNLQPVGFVCRWQSTGFCMDSSFPFLGLNSVVFPQRELDPPKRPGREGRDRKREKNEGRKRVFKWRRPSIVKHSKKQNIRKCSKMKVTTVGMFLRPFAHLSCRKLSVMIARDCYRMRYFGACHSVQNISPEIIIHMGLSTQQGKSLCPPHCSSGLIMDTCSQGPVQGVTMTHHVWGHVLLASCELPWHFRFKM